MLSDIYPEHEWVPWKFRVNTGFWNDITNQREYMNWVGKQLNYKEMSDWYKITQEVIKK
jgi:hypothetical protein